MNNEQMIGSLSSPVGPTPLVDTLPMVDPSTEQEEAKTNLSPKNDFVPKSRFGEFGEIKKGEFKSITDSKPIVVKKDDKPSSLLSYRSIESSDQRETNLPIVKEIGSNPLLDSKPIAERKPSNLMSSMFDRFCGSDTKPSSMLSNRSFALAGKEAKSSLPPIHSKDTIFSRIESFKHKDGTAKETVSSLPPLKAEKPSRELMSSHRFPVNKNSTHSTTDSHPAPEASTQIPHLPGVKKIESTTKGSSFSSLPRSKPIIDSVGESLSQLVALLASQSHHEIVDQPHYSRHEFENSDMYHRG